MFYKLPITLLAVAAVTAALGGTLQRAHGAGTETGLRLVHVGAGILVIALAALFVAWIATTSAQRDPDDTDASIDDETAADSETPNADESQRIDRAFIVADDGERIIPILGPYASEPEAAADLFAVQQRLDPQGKYAWSVETTADETVVGQANEYFAFAARG